MKIKITDLIACVLKTHTHTHSLLAFFNREPQNYEYTYLIFSLCTLVTVCAKAFSKGCS